jgi:type VI secretion system protein ImpA
MSSSIEALSKPVSEDLPSGENLEYDLQFQEMETLFDPKEKSGSSSSDEQSDIEPDWKSVEKLAEALLLNTRDLRVQVRAAIASIHTGGLPTFRDNLELLKIYVDDFWDTVHPQLDPEDNNDPTLRMNTLEMLNEHSLISMALDRVKLVELQGMGQFGVREVELARGNEMPDEGEEVPDITVIQQAFLRSDPEHLDALCFAVSESIELLADINNIWIDKSGDKEGLSLGNATKALRKVSAILSEFIPSQAGGTTDEDAPMQEAAGSVPVASVVITRRSDVVHVLGKICEYYSVHEPSSPVPLLLRRAQRLVEKSFLEILEDMVPDGLKQAKIVSGSTEKDA